MTKARILAQVVSAGNVLADGQVNAEDIIGLDISAAEILTKLKTVDGSGSGLDADLLDGESSAYYLDWTNVTNKPDPQITLAGDLSGSVTLTDLASGTLTGTLVTSGVVAGTYGSSTNIPQLTVDAKGRVTTVSNVAVSIPSGSLTFTGDVSGTGSTGSSTTLTLASVGTSGTYTKVTTDAKGRVTSGSTLSATDIPNLDASKITSGTLDAARLPSYVDDVLEYTDLASFPATGETAKIYVALDTNKTYRWSGSTYIEISASPGSSDSIVEGSSNLYYTNTRARNAISVTQNLNYDSTTGIITGPDLSAYQPILISGTSIKTINGESLLGSSDITIGVTASFPFYTANRTLDSIALLVGNYLPFYDYQGASKNIQLTT